MDEFLLDISTYVLSKSIFVEDVSHTLKLSRSIMLCSQ